MMSTVPKLHEVVVKYECQLFQDACLILGNTKFADL